MIHVAPCSCELHIRIRELEAELALTKATSDQFMHDAFDQKARAEKAETRLEKAIAALDVEHQEVIEQKARVAELESELEGCKDENLRLRVFEESWRNAFSVDTPLVGELMKDNHNLKTRAEKAEKELKWNIASRDSQIAVLQAINAELTEWKAHGAKLPSSRSQEKRSGVRVGIPMNIRSPEAE